MKKLYGVMGNPIAHSMSPVMINDLFNLYGIDASYLPFHVTPDRLEVAVKGLRDIGVAGFNVTVPHKTEIMAFLDEIDPLAKAIGAVNTVVNIEGKLIGYNTDGRGYVRGLKEEIPSLSGQTVLMIGAGGAARGIYFSMAEAGVKRIDICNRTPAKALELKRTCPFPVETEVYNLEKAEERLAHYDLLIQTTLIGMAPKIEEAPLSLKGLKQSSFASDIIYNPLETKFLREASSAGARTQNGIEMFVYQGALAFEIWTGIFPDTERMKENVLKQLGGFPC
jgi:shikimate dehydrogenase